MEIQIKKYFGYALIFLALAFFVWTVGFYAYKNIWPLVAPLSKTDSVKVDLSSAPVSFISRKAVAARPFDFKGILYLYLSNSLNSGIYSFSIDGAGDIASRFKLILGDKRSGDEMNISPSVSLDGKQLTFARKEMSASSFQIFTSDISGANPRQITNTPDKYKREPIFNPSGKVIAYISKNETPATSILDSNLPESWSTYLTDINGNSIKVADGVNPIFSPDEKKLLVLQNDGLHAFDISIWDKPKTLGLVVKTVGGRASYAMKINISSDGKMMAWPSVNQNNIVVSHINSWDNFSISPILVIKTKAYWTRFSPDGKYLAVDEWRKDKSGNEYPVIMGYDLSSGASERIALLTAADKGNLWFGAWK